MPQFCDRIWGTIVRYCKRLSLVKTSGTFHFLVSSHLTSDHYARSITSIIKTDTGASNWFSRLFLFNLSSNRFSGSCVLEYRFFQLRAAVLFLLVGPMVMSGPLLSHPLGPSNTYVSNLFKLIFSLEWDKNGARRWRRSLRAVQLVLELAVGGADGTFITHTSIGPRQRTVLTFWWEVISN